MKTNRYPSTEWIYKMQGFKISIGNESSKDTRMHDYEVCVINDNSIQAEANAAFICKAANSHDALLSALLDAKKTIEKYLSKDGTWNVDDLHVHNKIEDTLAAIEAAK